MTRDEANMREPANNQHGSVKRFSYNGPNSKSKDNSFTTDDWFNGVPTKAKSEQSIVGGQSELDDVWSIRKNVSANLKPKVQQPTITSQPSAAGHYSRHGLYNKSSKLNEDTSSMTGGDGSGVGRGGYSYGQGRSSYSYAGTSGNGSGDSPSPRFGPGPSTTQGHKAGGIGPPLISSTNSPTRSNAGRSPGSQYSRGKASDGWSSF